MAEGRQWVNFSELGEQGRALAAKLGVDVDGDWVDIGKQGIAKAGAAGRGALSEGGGLDRFLTQWSGKLEEVNLIEGRKWPSGVNAETARVMGGARAYHGTAVWGLNKAIGGVFATAMLAGGLLLRGGGKLAKGLISRASPEAGLAFAKREAMQAGRVLETAKAAEVPTQNILGRMGGAMGIPNKQARNIMKAEARVTGAADRVAAAETRVASAQTKRAELFGEGGTLEQKVLGAARFAGGVAGVGAGLVAPLATLGIGTAYAAGKLFGGTRSATVGKKFDAPFILGRRVGGGLDLTRSIRWPGLINANVPRDISNMFTGVQLNWGGRKMLYGGAMGLGAIGGLTADIQRRPPEPVQYGTPKFAYYGDVANADGLPFALHQNRHG